MSSVSRCVVLLLCLCAVSCTTLRYVIDEEVAPDTEIGILARDLMMDVSSTRTSFLLLRADFDPSLISMQESDGLLRVRGRIDRERLCPRLPTCVISFNAVTKSAEKWSVFLVELEVRDGNDHSPAFPSDQVYLEIPESAPIGSRFRLPAAIDPDVGSNYIQSYFIEPESPFELEMVRELDNQLFPELVLVEQLDIKSQELYTFQITATDGGLPPKSGFMTLNVKVLDDRPVFEETTVQVDLLEDSPIGSRVIKMHESNCSKRTKGEVTYKFADGLSAEVMEVFQVHPYSGDVTLKAPVDFEKTTSYQLTVVASGGDQVSLSSSCKVLVTVVDVNDNAPKIAIQSMTSTSDSVAYIQEGAAPGSFVALVRSSDADSGDNGALRVSLHGHEHFRLEQAFKDTLKIITTAALDREKIPEYNLTVVTEDFGSPPFKTVHQYTIRLTDKNDNPPLFSKSLYEVSVLENNLPGSYVTTVVARDLDEGENGKVTYTILDSDLPDGSPTATYFWIDSDSGSLHLLKSLDHESVQQIDVTIQAEDNGTNPLSSITTIRIKVVDQNDNYPDFTFPVLSEDSADVPLPLNAPQGYVALQVVAADVDEGVNSELSYRMIQGDKELFSMNRDTGEIVLRKSLSAQRGDVMAITVVATDNGRNRLSRNATIRFIVSDSEQFIVDKANSLLRRLDKDFLVYLALSIMFGAGSVVLLIVAVVVLTRKKYKSWKYLSGRKGDDTPTLDHGFTESNVYTAPGGHHSATTSSIFDDVSVAEEGSAASETKMFLPSKHFHPTSAWQGDKHCLQVSMVGATDQLSTRDSGKGDSDFNDSGSDISRDVCRNFSTFHPRGIRSSLAESNFSECVPGSDNSPARGISQLPGYSTGRRFNQSFLRSSACVPIPGRTLQMYTCTLPSRFQHPVAVQRSVELFQGSTVITVASGSQVATIL